MQIQVNTASSLRGQGHEALERWASDQLAEQLGRFRDHVTRIEVHLSDENSGKTSADDKRCLLEARLANHPPLAASHHAPNVDAAFRGASDKLKHALEHALDKVLKNHRDRDSIRRDLDAAAG